MSQMPDSPKQTSSGAGVPAFAAVRRHNLLRLEVFLWMVIAAGVVIGVSMARGIRSDFHNFYSAGNNVLHGRIAELYHPGAVLPEGGGTSDTATPFMSAPVSAYLYTFMAWLPRRAATIVFRIQNTLAMALVLFLAYRHFRPGARAEHQQFRVALLGMIVLYQPMWSLYRVGGQSTPTVMLFLTLAYFANLRGWDWCCALLWVLAACIKPIVLIGLGLFALLSGPRMILRMAIAGLGVAAVSVLLMGWDVHQEFLHQLRSYAGISYPWWNDSSVFVALNSLQSAAAAANRSPAVLEGVKQLLRLAEVAILVWLVREFRHLDWTAETRKRIVFMLAIAFDLAFAPTVWEHYLTLMIFFMVNVLAVYGRLGRSSRVLLFATLGALVLQNLELNLQIAWHFPIQSTAGLVLIGLYKSAALLLLLSLFVAVRRELVQPLRP